MNTRISNFQNEFHRNKIIMKPTDSSINPQFTRATAIISGANNVNKSRLANTSANRHKFSKSEVFSPVIFNKNPAAGNALQKSQHGSKKSPPDAGSWTCRLVAPIRKSAASKASHP